MEGALTMEEVDDGGIALLWFFFLSFGFKASQECRELLFFD